MTSHAFTHGKRNITIEGSDKVWTRLHLHAALSMKYENGTMHYKLSGEIATEQVYHVQQDKLVDLCKPAAWISGDDCIRAGQIKLLAAPVDDTCSTSYYEAGGDNTPSVEAVRTAISQNGRANANSLKFSVNGQDFTMPFTNIVDGPAGPSTAREVNAGHQASQSQPNTTD